MSFANLSHTPSDCHHLIKNLSSILVVLLLRFFKNTKGKKRLNTKTCKFFLDISPGKACVKFLISCKKISGNCTKHKKEILCCWKIGKKIFEEKENQSFGGQDEDGMGQLKTAVISRAYKK